MSGEAAADPSGVVLAPGKPAPVRAVFLGSGSFAVPILDALAALPGVEVVAVVSAPDRPVGRKAIVTSTPVAARARALGLHLHQPGRVRSPESVAMLVTLAPDLAVLADYGQLIPRSLIELPARGFLNLHPSSLPRHRGATPIPATILAGDNASAVTLLCLTEELDAGPIVAVAPLEVRLDDTTSELEGRAAEVAALLLARALPEWLAGRLTPTLQPAEGMTLTRPLRREDGRIDPLRPAVELERQVRAFQPWPGSFLETSGGRLIVWRASLVPGIAEAGGQSEPGNLLRFGDGLALATGAGLLRLDEVQLAGGRRMTSAALTRGSPGLLGNRG